KLGLNRPMIVQYLDWLGNALHGNFGNSLTNGQSVIGEIGAAAPATLELIVIAQVFGILIAVTGATAAVVTRRRWLDATITGIALAANSMPPFIAGLLLLDLLSTKYHLVSSIGWVTTSAGGLGGNLQAIALPAFVLSLAVFPAYLRIFRGELMQQLDGEEYVVLARLKGISTARLIGRHVAPNSLVGLLTVIGISTANLFAATVIIEQIFSIPGLGLLLFNSVTNHDSTTVLGCISLITAISEMQPSTVVESWLVTELNSSSPRPGIEKICSMITVAANRLAVLIPMTVSSPTSELGATCRPMRRAVLMPFSLARTTYSSPSSCCISSPRKIRRYAGNTARLSTNAGSAIACRLPPRPPALVVTQPIDETRWYLVDSRSRSSSPAMNGGIEFAASAMPVIVASSQRSRVTTATVAPTTAITMPKIWAITISSSVAGAAWPISPITLCPFVSELPKFPCSALPSQSRYCTTSGLSRPSLTRSSAAACAL